MVDWDTLRNFTWVLKGKGFVLIKFDKENGILIYSAHRLSLLIKSP